MPIQSLRLRQARPGERPAVENAGTDAAPQYRLTAVADTKNRLHVPGASFTTRDRARLQAYFRRLSEEGIDALTAPRGLFGLTDKQFQTVHADLSPKMGFSTADKPPRSVINAVADRLTHRLVIDGRLLARLEAAEPFPAELQDLSRGTALAILLRQAGLQFRPQMKSGELLYEVVDAGEETDVPRNRAGRQEAAEALQGWPVGWELERSPGQTAPELFQIIQAQIDGYSLAEALEAIGSRLELPLVIDQRSLTVKGIDIADVQVSLPAVRYSYDRILSRILFQARLKGTLRVDERGTPFYWIVAL